MDPEIKQTLTLFNQQIKELTSVYQRAASQHGVSVNEFWIWYAVLAMEEEQSQQSICDMWFLPKQTVNSAIAGMVKKGHVYLESLPGTHNKKVIRPTEAGRAYGEHIITGIFGAEQRALEAMSPQERQTCIDLLTNYISHLKAEL